MTDADDVIDNFLLEHRGTSKEEIAAYNRAYYLKNRKLKGRPKVGDVPQPKRAPKVASRPDRGGESMKRVVVKSAAQKRAEDRRRIQKNQERIAVAKKKAAKLPPKKRNAVEKKIDSLEKGLNKVRGVKNPFDGAKISKSKKPQNIKDLGNPFPKGVPKVQKKSAVAAKKKADHERLINSEKRLAAARRSVKTLPPEKRNAVEKKLDSAEKKLKGLKKKAGNKYMDVVDKVFYDGKLDELKDVSKKADEITRWAKTESRKIDRSGPVTRLPSPKTVTKKKQNKFGPFR